MMIYLVAIKLVLPAFYSYLSLYSSSTKIKKPSIVISLFINSIS